jgi:polyisoprenoid-binding protein YceI
VLKICAAFCAVLVLAACGAPKLRQERAPGAAPARPAAGAAAAGVPVYEIDPAQSELRVLVYRAGPLARLGHNHVIINRALAGWVDAQEPLSSASFSLRVPVAEFVVDDAQARSEEGADFSTAVPDDAKAGTRHNMLGAALLDAERYPTVTLTSTGIRQQPGALLATMTVDLKGRESVLGVPFMLERAADRIAASGTAVLRQSELGLSPFSVMLGALQVQDEITVKFKLIALKSRS